jgi:hypothetical protein|nr:hypothetical protein [Kofleriaceae bacterium]
MAMTHRLVIAVALLAGCMTMTTPQTHVTIENDEANPLFSLFLDPVGSDTSTTSLLGASQLFPGDTRELTAACGTYDVTVMVAGGDQPAGAGMCVIHAQDLCASDPFVISSANCALDP